MATTTTNYGLTKPATTDNYDIAVPNANMDIIDTQMATAPAKTDYTRVPYYATDESTTANAIVITSVPSYTAYVDGSRFLVKVKNTTTSTAATISINGLTAKTIVIAKSATPYVGDLNADVTYEFVYNSTIDKFRIQSGNFDAYKLGGQVASYYAAKTDVDNIADGTTAAAKATKLATARTISATGDATGSTSFDGSANASMALTLAASGATAGTYKSVTVDTKGRVTAGTNPTTAAGYGITDAVVKVASCSNTAITTTSQATVLTYTPSAQGNFNINTYVRDVTAATTIDVELTYTDSGGSQTVEIFNGSAPVGSNMLPPYFFNATAAAITLKITAGTANQVYVSAALEE